MNELQNERILALTNINSSKKKKKKTALTSLSSWNSLTHVILLQFQSLKIFYPLPPPLSLLLFIHSGKNLAICYHILTKVNLAHLLFTVFLATKWTSSKMASY